MQYLLRGCLVYWQYERQNSEIFCIGETNPLKKTNPKHPTKQQQKTQPTNQNQPTNRTQQNKTPRKRALGSPANKSDQTSSGLKQDSQIFLLQCPSISFQVRICLMWLPLPDESTWKKTKPNQTNKQKKPPKKTWKKLLHDEGGWEGEKNGRLSLPQPPNGRIQKGC